MNNLKTVRPEDLDVEFLFPKKMRKYAKYSEAAQRDCPSVRSATYTYTRPSDGHQYTFTDTRVVK